MLPTGVVNSPAAPEGTGLQGDKMSKEKIASNFDAFVGEVLRRIPEEDRRSFKVVVEDSYEVGGQNWTAIPTHAKVVALTFIYTGCPDICPLLTQKMVDVQDELGALFGTKIAFVSISFDPERDTPEVLKDYAQFWGAKPEGWSFLTGSLEAVRDVTRRYGVFFAKKEDGSVEHSQLTTLIDADGQMRVQYLGARFDAEEFRGDLVSLVDKE